MSNRLPRVATVVVVAIACFIPADPASTVDRTMVLTGGRIILEQPAFANRIELARGGCPEGTFTFDTTAPAPPVKAKAEIIALNIVRRLGVSDYVAHITRTGSAKGEGVEGDAFYELGTPNQTLGVDLNVKLYLLTEGVPCTINMDQKKCEFTLPVSLSGGYSGTLGVPDKEDTLFLSTTPPSGSLSRVGDKRCLEPFEDLDVAGATGRVSGLTARVAV